VKREREQHKKVRHSRRGSHVQPNQTLLPLSCHHSCVCASVSKRESERVSRVSNFQSDQIGIGKKWAVAAAITDMETPISGPRCGV